ncbi:MAG: hypothetical protein Ct9H300mP9_7190 [Candidatus Neomarinimicrobiota bacterium]|nr:MAG: hypothetical protein Ct9H300mP9_7190 [Candidatus Neomarinimicrobiota bacterium]
MILSIMVPLIPIRWMITPISFSLALMLLLLIQIAVGSYLVEVGRARQWLPIVKKGVRAAVYYNGPDEIVRLSRQHNNANILSLGARFMSVKRYTM